MSPSLAKSPEIPPSLGKSPDMSPSLAESPDIPPSHAESPEIPPSLAKSPDIPQSSHASKYHCITPNDEIEISNPPTDDNDVESYAKNNYSPVSLKYENISPDLVIDETADDYSKKEDEQSNIDAETPSIIRKNVRKRANIADVIPSAYSINDSKRSQLTNETPSWRDK